METIRIALLSFLVLAVAAFAQAQAPAAGGRAAMEQLRRVLPASESFDRWLERNGELPPDFAALPPQPFLPDPLATTRDGRPERVTRDEWPQRRQEIAALVEDCLLGHAPPAPGNVRATVESEGQGAGFQTWNVLLEFGPDHAAKLRCVLYLPPGGPSPDRPAPVFVCDSPRYLAWCEGAMAEGFAFCLVSARDSSDPTRDNSLAYADLFGDYDWSAFRRRGWSYSRALDWLETLDFIDADRIFVGGHSRSAKTAMAAAAFDERFAGVLASSPGAGGSMPYRYADQSYYGESAEILTRTFPDWVSQRVRFFAGRENRLPADSHFLYALFAPRPVLMSTAVNDWVEGTWAIEQVYRSVQPVYAMLGRPGSIAIRWRAGQHSVDPETMKAFSRFLLLAARGEPPAEAWPFTPFHPWDQTSWRSVAGTDLDAAAMPDPAPRKPGGAADWPAQRDDIRRRILWLLGEGPAYRPMPVTFGEGESPAVAEVLARNWPPPPQKARCRFGQGLNGDLYYPSPEAAGSGRKYPGVVWVGPFNTSGGYIGSYRAGEIAHMTLAGGGFVTLAFDPIGCGTRQEERRGFYQRHPGWSLMGRMVLDVRHAVDALAACPDVDAQRIYLVGYAMGGMEALLAAALDDRVAGVVSVAGFTPFRTDTDDRGMGGVRRYSHLYGWMPRMGAFVGHETKVPVDFDEILAAVAPRPVLVVAPTLDWHASAEDVAAAVAQARRVYALLEAPPVLALETPEQINALTDPIQAQVVQWLQRQAQVPTEPTTDGD